MSGFAVPQSVFNAGVSSSMPWLQQTRLMASNMQAYNALHSAQPSTGAAVKPTAPGRTLLTTPAGALGGSASGKQTLGA